MKVHQKLDLRRTVHHADILAPNTCCKVYKLEARMKLKKMLDIHNLGLVLIKTHTVFIDISCCNKRCILLPQLPLEI